MCILKYPLITLKMLFPEMCILKIQREGGPDPPPLTPSRSAPALALILLYISCLYSCYLCFFFYQTRTRLKGSYSPSLVSPYTSPFRLFFYPREGPGVKSRMCPPYPQRDRKRRLIGAVCRNHRIKRLVPCRCLDGHVKEPYEMSMALGARP